MTQSPPDPTRPLGPRDRAVDPTRPLGPRDRAVDPTGPLERDPAPREGTQVLRPDDDRRLSAYTEEPAATALEPDYRDEYGGEEPLVASRPAGTPGRRPTEGEPRPRRRYALGIVAAWTVVGLLIGAIGALLLLPEEQDPADAQLLAAADEIAARDAEIAARDAEIVTRDARIAEVEGQIAGLQAQIAERDAQIAQLQAQQAEDGAAADAAQAEREQALAEREAALNARDQELAARESAVAEREAAVAEAEQSGGEQGLELPDLSLPSELPSVDLPSADEARGAFERFIDRVRDLFRLG